MARKFSDFWAINLKSQIGVALIDFQFNVSSGQCGDVRCNIPTVRKETKSHYLKGAGWVAVLLDCQRSLVPRGRAVRLHPSIDHLAVHVVVQSLASSFHAVQHELVVQHREDTCGNPDRQTIPADVVWTWSPRKAGSHAVRPFHLHTP